MVARRELKMHPPTRMTWLSAVAAIIVGVTLPSSAAAQFVTYVHDALTSAPTAGAVAGVNLTRASSLLGCAPRSCSCASPPS